MYQVSSVFLSVWFYITTMNFLKFYLNIIADNEPVEDKEGEDDGHGEGDEAELEGVHLCL